MLAANNAPTIITEIPKPPFIFLNKAAIESKRFSAIFDFSNIIPMNINIGIATKVSFVIIPNILLGRANKIDRSKLLVRLHTKANRMETPDKVKATGYPSIRTKITITNRDIASIFKILYQSFLLFLKMIAKVRRQPLIIYSFLIYIILVSHLLLLKTLKVQKKKLHN